MNRARLKTLLNHLKTVPEKNFNIEAWNCGTAACAVGHAGQVPELRLQGFVILGYTPHPCYRDLTGWDAVRAFFGLTYAEADNLFCGAAYPDGKNTTLPEVIDRLSKFLEVV